MDEHTTRIRASDEERERVAALVRTAMSEGRLSLAEGEQRLAEVYAVTYRDELPRLTADLPSDPPRPEAGPARRRVRGLGAVALAAVIATIWALSSGSLVGPAILVGVAALVTLKHSARRRWHPRHHSTEETPVETGTGTMCR